MRKLIQVSLLVLTFTASIHAGDMQQPFGPPPPSSPVATEGQMSGGLTETALSVLEAVLSLI